MIYWKSLEQRALEAAAIDSGSYLSNASNILGPVQLTKLISYLSAHDYLINPDDDRYRAAVVGLLCDEIRALDLDIGNVYGDFLNQLGDRCGSSLQFLRLGCMFKGKHFIYFRI
jgi:hypothetical protein